MGFFGKVRDFFFETEAQILIKCELETQRESNKKLYEWNEKLQSHNSDLQEKFDTMLVKMGMIYDDQVTQYRALHKKLNPLMKQVDSIVDVLLEDGALNSTLTKHHDGIKERLSIVYDHVTKQTNKTNELVDSIVDSKVTHLHNMADSIQKTVEHINGFLNDEEYKQQWDMKQVEAQLVEVRQLLETVDALFPKPSGGTQEKIQELFESTDKLTLKPKDIMESLEFSKRQVYSALSRMCKNGSLLLLNRGEYTTQAKLDKYNNDQKKAIEESDKVLAENYDTDGNIGIG